MTKAMNYDLMVKLAEHINWDPSITDPEKVSYTINREKINHVMKNHFKDTPYAAVFEEKEGDTLYKAMAGHRLSSLVAYAYGYVSADDLVEFMKDGKDAETSRYAFHVQKGEDYVNQCREASEKLWEIRKSGIFEYKVPEKDWKMDLPDAGTSAGLNKLLSSASLPPLHVMLDTMKSTATQIAEAQKQQKKAEKRQDELEKDVLNLQQRMAEYAMQIETQVTNMDLEAHDGVIPSGSVAQKLASEVFGMSLKSDFKVPVFEWDGVHPDVPKVDPNYIFREKELVRVLYAIATNQRAYLSGHTGSGKTTLIEQVAAHLNFPFVRVNFDSEITRMDLIGRDTLSTEEGNTISTFVDGILPRAMAAPCIFCADEIDFVRPDVAYVMQAALEGNSLRITEDGDKIITPHPMFRMFATGNTVGQGDEHGMYQGARPQSLAFLDRFTIWVRVDYLRKKDREDLVKRHVPTLSTEDQRKLSLYMDEHIAAFTGGKVSQPISPRGMLAVAKATIFLGSFKEALEMTVLDKASGDDRATLAGLVDRVS